MLVLYSHRLVKTYQILNALKELPPHKIELALTIGLELEVVSS